jgi:hypothetical protein
VTHSAYSEPFVSIDAAVEDCEAGLAQLRREGMSVESDDEIHVASERGFVIRWGQAAEAAASRKSDWY